MCVTSYLFCVLPNRRLHSAGQPKVAELEHAGRDVEQEVLRLDVSVADATPVEVRQGAEHLVDGELRFRGGGAGRRKVVVGEGSGASVLGAMVLGQKKTQNEELRHSGIL